jgi:hypothetical protein
MRKSIPYLSFYLRRRIPQAAIRNFTFILPLATLLRCLFFNPLHLYPLYRYTLNALPVPFYNLSLLALPFLYRSIHYSTPSTEDRESIDSSRGRRLYNVG